MDAAVIGMRRTRERRPEELLQLAEVASFSWSLFPAPFDVDKPARHRGNSREGTLSPRSPPCETSCATAAGRTVLLLETVIASARYHPGSAQRL